MRGSGAAGSGPVTGESPGMSLLSPLSVLCALCVCSVCFLPYSSGRLPSTSPVVACLLAVSSGMRLQTACDARCFVPAGKEPAQTPFILGLIWGDFDEQTVRPLPQAGMGSSRSRPSIRQRWDLPGPGPLCLTSPTPSSIKVLKLTFYTDLPGGKEVIVHTGFIIICSFPILKETEMKTFAWVPNCTGPMPLGLRGGHPAGLVLGH